jgi:hypothetical protein
VLLVGFNIEQGGNGGQGCEFDVVILLMSFDIMLEDQDFPKSLNGASNNGLTTP